MKRIAFSLLCFVLSFGFAQNIDHFVVEVKPNPTVVNQ
jgi:hypothetical protein